MKPSPEVNQLLLNETAALEQQNANISIQIKQLQNQQAANLYKIKLINDDLERQSKIAQSSGDLINASLHDTKPKSVAGLGLRDAIRRILAQANHGLRTRDIVRQLNKRDFQYTATTALSTRVSNEMSRMARANHVRKRGTLYYANEGGS